MLVAFPGTGNTGDESAGSALPRGAYTVLNWLLLNIETAKEKTGRSLGRELCVKWHRVVIPANTTTLRPSSEPRSWSELVPQPLSVLCTSHSLLILLDNNVSHQRGAVPKLRRQRDGRCLLKTIRYFISSSCRPREE